MKTISVIIPNYNNAHYLASAIQSVLHQTFTDYEIIVVDDGSTDNSKEVVAAFGDKVRYIWQENKGLAGARNTGIHAARGELIGLLDADDEWLPNYLENMILLSRRFPDAAVYYCSAQAMDTEGKALPQVFGGPARQPESLYYTLLRANFLIPSTILMRRHVILDAGLFDQSLRSCEDWDLWLRILPSHPIVGTNECLVRYRIHGSSLSANPAGMQNAHRLVIGKHFGSDDGKREIWSQDKRRAYGGVYRYHALTSIQRQSDWPAGAVYLRQALLTDPTLATDLELFYELAFGTQPPGYRETAHCLNLEQNAKLIMNMLVNVFDENSSLLALRRTTFGTANYAIGLVAYNTYHTNLSKVFLSRALAFLPKLLLDQRVVLTFIKSFLHPSWIRRFGRRKKFLSQTGKFKHLT